MNKNYLALLRSKTLSVLSFTRSGYLRLLGLKIGKNSVLGKIICEWPNNVKIGHNCMIQDRVRFDIKNPFSGENYVSIANRVFIGHGCFFNCTAKIFIGDNCLIASNTSFIDIGHSIALGIPMNVQPIISSNITIGKDVWIGAGCIILKGVTIGDGSIVGAGSVVNKSIPEYQIWAGSPARYIRTRQ